MRRMPLGMLAALAVCGLGGFSGEPVTITGLEPHVSRETLRSHAWRHNGGMHPSKLNELGAKRRRAAQGKPGKRGKRGRA